VATLVDGELSLDVWSTLPIARQRFLLGLAVHQVWIYSPDVPMDERVLVVWHGDELPTPRGDRGTPTIEKRVAPQRSTRRSTDLWPLCRREHRNGRSGEGKGRAALGGVQSVIDQ
jgi:hypothetical protein